MNKYNEMVFGKYDNHNPVALNNIILWLMMLVSSMMIIKIDDRAILIYIELLFILAVFIRYQKMVLPTNIFFWMTLISCIITLVLSQKHNIPYSYKRGALIAGRNYILVFIVIIFFNTLVKIKGLSIVSIVRNGLKAMCLSQYAWSILDYICYAGFKFDLNKYIFVSKLHMVANASQYKNGVLLASGLGWHPAIIAPVIVLGFFLFDSIWIKILIGIVTILCGNITAFIGYALCIIISIFIKLGKVKYNKISYKAIISIIIILFLIILLLSNANLRVSIMQYIDRVIGKFNFTNDVSSSTAHLRYYTSYPLVLKFSTLKQIIFGYGQGSSGYPITALFDQYSDIGYWATESDFMNILLSDGIFGFLCFYSLLLSILMKGRKINNKYSSIIFIFIIQGITYNIQFQWVILIELIFMILINYKYDIFNY